MAEKFEKPAYVRYFKLQEVKVHFPAIYADSPDISMGLLDDNSDEPGNYLSTNTISSAVQGWNQINWNYNLTDHETFYLSVAPSLDYAVGLDTNSVQRNGMGRWYSSGNPPNSYWRELGNNIAIEIYVGYSVASGFGKLNPEAKLCRKRRTIR